MSVDLPEPETPVTHVNTPNGRSTSIFLRVCCRAPTILIEDVELRRDFGTGMDFLPARYSRVSDWGAHALATFRPLLARKSSSVPFHTHSRPTSRRPGPRPITLPPAR